MTKEDIFKILKIDNMTDSQKKAVLTTKTPILISASAGSGKTFVLTTRYLFKILNLKNIHSVKKILVLTFSKAAADEMLNRIFDKMSLIIKKFPN